jgi:hypothetical protein
LNTGLPGINLSNPHLYNVMSRPGFSINRFSNVDHYSTSDYSGGFSPTPWLGWGANEQYFRGYIAELLMFNRELTPAERSTVATVYLKQRFGL